LIKGAMFINVSCLLCGKCSVYKDQPWIFMTKRYA